MPEQGSDILCLASDYMEGAHPAIIDALVRTNRERTSGYGTDGHSERARTLIRAACECPDADVFFLTGGTQTNVTVIGTALAPWQGVVAAQSGHVSVHEAGAIERGGHKVIELPATLGKIGARQVEACVEVWENDVNRDHMVMPGMVYISQPTEYGTLYSLAELEGLSEVCHRHGMKLYVDGARLAYALAADENDVTLADLARLCDAFCIGGTKCGALFGEAVVIPVHDSIPHFFTQLKQHGALFAKGRILGLQFEVMFEDGLYERIGRSAVEAACRIREALVERGYELYFDTPTNQTFVMLDDQRLEELGRRVEMDFWERIGEGRTVMRIATSWATTPEDVTRLVAAL